MDKQPGTVLTGEHSDHKVAAVFEEEGRAREVAEAIVGEAGLQPEQVLVVTPRDSSPGRKIQPESRGIWQTILISHYKLAIAGIVLGLLVFGLLWAMGVDAVRQSVGLSLFALVFFGASFGLFAGGLVSLRPDQDAYALKVREAVGEGNYAVVVHAFSVDERERAQHALERRGGDTVQTL